MRRATAAACLLLWLAASSARAEEIGLPAPGTGAWRPLEFRGAKRPTTYTPTSVDGLEAIRADSDCSASALVLPLSGIDLQRTPRLQWSWRVESELAIADERVKAGDDFAARVYVMHRFDAAHATLLQRARHRLARVFYRRDPPGSVLNFVWTGRSEPGAVWDNPYTSASKMIALASGSSPGWRREDVDVARRYAAAFGRPPPALMGIAVMTDTDDSCGRATAWFGGFRFVDRSGAGASVRGGTPRPRRASHPGIGAPRTRGRFAAGFQIRRLATATGTVARRELR